MGKFVRVIIDESVTQSNCFYRHSEICENAIVRAIKFWHCLTSKTAAFRVDVLLVLVYDLSDGVHETK